MCSPLVCLSLTEIYSVVHVLAPVHVLYKYMCVLWCKPCQLAHCDKFMLLFVILFCIEITLCGSQLGDHSIFSLCIRSVPVIYVVTWSIFIPVHYLVSSLCHTLVRYMCSSIVVSLWPYLYACVSVYFESTIWTSLCLCVFSFIDTLVSVSLFSVFITRYRVTYL